MSLTNFNLFAKPLKFKVCSYLLIKQHLSKTVLGDSLIQHLDKTLLGRIMSYLDTKVSRLEDKRSADGTNIINNLALGKSTVLRNLNVDQLTGVFYSANTHVVSHNKQKMIKVLDLLDVECCLRINNMDSSNILKVLKAYMHVIPNRITEYKFYHYATDNFNRCLIQATKKELLQFIFYIGLQKNSTRAHPLLKTCLRKIDKNILESLTVEDLCIICNATYRTHLKISNQKILDKIKDMINNNLYILRDPALLVTLIKTMKHNACQDDEILSTLKCTIFFNQTSQYYTFPAMCHILSLYADVLYYEEDLLKLFMDKCIYELRHSGDLKPKTYLTEQLRPKDITRFLWILSRLGYTKIEEEVFKNVIVPNIRKRVVAGLYNKHPEELTDTVLYLQMLKYRADELIGFALSPERVSHIKDTQSKHRLKLLLTMLKFEDEELFKILNIKGFDFPSYNQNPQVQLRPELQRLFKVLKAIAHDLNITSFQMDMQIPHLNIVGITAYKECNNKATPKLVANIEVLDDTNCVKNKSCWPSGYMQVKLRILEQSSVPLITIPQSDIDGLTEEDLQLYLKDEFQLIVY